MIAVKPSSPFHSQNKERHLSSHGNSEWEAAHHHSGSPRKGWWNIQQWLTSYMKQTGRWDKSLTEPSQNTALNCNSQSHKRHFRKTTDTNGKVDSSSDFNLASSCHSFFCPLKGEGLGNVSSSVYSKADRAVHFLSNKSRSSITLGGRSSGHPICEECPFLSCNFGCHLGFLEFSKKIKKKKAKL